MFLKGQNKLRDMKRDLSVFALANTSGSREGNEAIKSQIVRIEEEL